MSSTNTVSRYAILIGINAYPDRPLAGCVRDVKAVKEYLKRVSNNNNDTHIELFIAANQNSPSIGTTDTSSDDPSRRPTYRNITNALENVTTAAKPGDLVYIHFSGHGTRCEPYAEFSSQSTGDLALVLLADEKRNGSNIFLRGPRLALALNAMVEKGLIVTVVLDCCFSGSVYRREDNPKVRFYPGSEDLLSPDVLPDVEEAKEDIIEDTEMAETTTTPDPSSEGESRDASMRLNWLINPDGYSILAACGPHEEGLEREFDGETRGILSYLLLQALQHHGGLGKRLQDIYAFLQAKFRDGIWQQNPILYGNKRQGFFGTVAARSLDAHDTAVVPIVRAQDGSVELHAGQAQGVCVGDIFALCSAANAVGSGNSGLERDQVLGKVTKVGALVSQLNVDEGGEQIAPQIPISVHHVETGWIARPLTRLSLQKFRIQPSPNITSRAEWLTALNERSLDLYEDGEIGAPSFRVDLNIATEEYEIRDVESGQKITNLPPMPANSSQTEKQTSYSLCAKILEHLARYSLAKQLTTMEPADLAQSFAKSFIVQITTRSSGTVSHVGSPVVEVYHSSDKKWTFELQVENKNPSHAIYVYVHNMGPLWQVEGIDMGSYQVIPPRDDDQNFSGVVKKKLRTMVPAEMVSQGYRRCEDIIKVFVTSRPTSFDILELPKIGRVASPPKDSSSRISWSSGGHDDASGCLWAAVNFTVYTTLKE
ncbi:caspase domain-containing protein [Podospora didyma]|uniref:Caspase domain-containing protein n=1 Tax=Podospora didyma TaxID=330526 RepID=A0AAE0P0P2_9PEZI|nr:caspase domain-containing protein [Podospora didyma]